MANSNKDALDTAIEKVECSHNFTEEEVRALKAVAYTWRGLEAFGRVASVVRTILTYLGWIIAVYLAVKAGAIDFIKGALK